MPSCFLTYFEHENDISNSLNSNIEEHEVNTIRLTKGVSLNAHHIKHFTSFLRVSRVDFDKVDDVIFILNQRF
jgi:hypothetical protein